MVKNVKLFGRRTSMRLSTEEWDALFEICKYESIEPHEFCERCVVKSADTDVSATGKVRTGLIVYLMREWRAHVTHGFQRQKA